jgi:hypothetical protein
MGANVIDRARGIGNVALFPMPAPARTAARQSLADAIQEGAAEAALEASKAAVGRGMRMCDQAEERLAEAVEAVAAAKAAQATRMASAAATAGALLATDRGLRDARARQTDAEDELDASRAALSSVEAASAEADRALEAAKLAVSNAAKRVIKTAIPSTIAKALELRAELDAKVLELTAALNKEVAYLRFVTDKQCDEFPYSGETTDQDRQRWDIVDREKKILDWDIQRVAFANWKQALAELMSDADAALPVS